MIRVAKDEFVSISELRQWEYCPRVVWHGRVLGKGRTTTFKMQQGIEDEETKQRLETRRTFHAYGLEACGRRFKVFVQSDRLLLSGIVDMILELGSISIEERSPVGSDQRLVPVEFKSTFSQAPSSHHLLQLAAYGMVIEDMTGSPVGFGFLVSLPSGRVRKVAFDDALRAKVENARQAVLACLADGVMPPPTPQRGKCTDCEFRRFCNDIW